MDRPKVVLVIPKATIFGLGFGDFSAWGLTAEGSNCGGRCSFAVRGDGSIGFLVPCWGHFKQDPF